MIKTLRHSLFSVFALQRKYFVFYLLLLNFHAFGQSDAYLTLQNKIQILNESSDCEEILTFLDEYQSKQHATDVLVSLARSKCLLKMRQDMESIPQLLEPVIHVFQYKSDSLSVYFVARALEISAHYAFLSGERDSSVELLNSSASYYQNNEDFKSALYNYNMIGTIYQLDMEYSKALDHYLLALDLFQNHPIDSSYYVELMVDVGLVYYKVGLYEKSIEIYKNLLINPSSLMLKATLADVYNNLGLNYFELDSLEKAYDNLLLASKEYERLNSLSNLSKIYNNLATIENEYHNNNATSLEFYQKSLAIKETLNDKQGIAHTNLNIAKIYYEDGFLDESMSYARRALHLNDSLNHKEELSNTHKFLVVLYEKMGNYKTALDHSKQSALLDDSLHNIIVAQNISQLEQKHFLENQMKEMDIITREKKHIEDRLKLNKSLNLVIGSLVVILVVFFLYYVYVMRHNQKVKNAIHKKNLRLTSYSALVQGQEDERKRLARDLHDGVGNSLALLNLRLQSEGSDETLTLVQNISDEIRSISHNLTPHILEKLGLKESLKELCNSWSELDIIVDLQFLIPESYFPGKATQLIIYRIVQEMIKNAAERGKANYISVQFKEYPADLLIIVEDNGKGFNKNEDNGGIGLQNINSRIEYLDGKLTIESNSNGTSFYISIPKTIENIIQ